MIKFIFQDTINQMAANIEKKLWNRIWTAIRVSGTAGAIGYNRCEEQCPCYDLCKARSSDCANNLTHWVFNGKAKGE